MTKNLELTRHEYLYLLCLLESLDAQIKAGRVVDMRLKQTNDNLLKKLQGK